MSQRAWFGWLFVGFACLYLLTSGGHFYASDDMQKYLTLDAWWRTGSPAFAEGWTVGVGGKHYSWFPLGASVFMLPGYGLGHLASAVLPWVPVDFVARFCITLQNALVSAALVTLLAAFARRLGHSREAALFAALALGLGTMVWPYAKTAWSEPAATCFLLAACLALWQAVEDRFAGWWAPLLAGAALAAAVSIRLELAVAIPGVLIWLLWRQRNGALARGLAWMSLPLAIAGAAALWYNLVRYGQVSSLENFRLVQGAVVFPAGGRPVWALSNMWHYTFNPSDGLFWLAPATLLGLVGARAFWRACPAAVGLLLAALGPLWVFYTAFWGLSDWAWGQRYAYVFQPFLLLGAAALWDRAARFRAAWLGLAGLGLAVQLVALPHNFNYLYERERAAHANIAIQAIMADPAHAPLLQAWRATPATLSGGLALLAAPRPSDPLSLEAYRARAQFVPDMWPFLVLLTPLPRWAITGVVLVLLVGLGLALRRLRTAWPASQS